MSPVALLKQLNKPRFYYLYAFLVLVLSIIMSAQGFGGFIFPISSYSILGNMVNERSYIFNTGIVISCIFMAIYVRYITRKLFSKGEIFRVSYVTPFITAIFIGVFPTSQQRNVHGVVAVLNAILFVLLAPINAVSLWRMDRRLFYLVATLTVIFINITLMTFAWVPFNPKQLGVLESLVILFLLAISSVLDWFAHHDRIEVYQ